jgi:hypothetical protein
VSLFERQPRWMPDWLWTPGFRARARARLAAVACAVLFVAYCATDAASRTVLPLYVLGPLGLAAAWYGWDL